MNIKLRIDELWEQTRQDEKLGALVFREVQRDYIARDYVLIEGTDEVCEYDSEKHVNGLVLKVFERDNTARLTAIEALTEEYFEERAKMPDSAQLDRLADLALYDDLSDKTPYKIANTEYPFMGTRMLDERKARNVSSNALELEQERKSLGSKRERSPYENSVINRKARSQNEARHKKYQDFISGKTEGVKRVVIKEA